jgi:hypothetical protein
LIEKRDDVATPAEFFREVLVPLAEAARREGKSFFPLGSDPQADSYYVEPARRVMTRADFELRAAESLEDFFRELAALWASEGHGELAALAPRLRELVVQEANEDDEEEVSPFIYAMS